MISVGTTVRLSARLTTFCIAVIVGGSARADEPVSFNRDVRPILADHCFRCHGPDAQTREAELRLDLATGALEGDHPAILPGKPDESPLMQRIMASDEAEMMPPPDSGKTLTVEQKNILRRWVEQGAVYQGHWAFEPVQRPEIPVSGEAQPQANPIDAFLAARLAKDELNANPEASREVLVRRVAFALTGLPPTIPEIEAYLADAEPGAYERMVDRYLASPHFGEEMGRHWLDVARYADTHGLHLDNERQMWAYRDWVVKAFNDNIPYDQFTVWQVAGDLLPEPTTEQLVATGFNRCNVTTSEGGSIAQEFVYRYAVERTTAVAEAWLGLTAGCAVCHDHKYDPLTSREFYSLYAFFNNAADPAMDGNVNVTPPFLRLPTPEQKAAAEAAGKVEREALAWLMTISGHAMYVEPRGREGEEETGGDVSASTLTSHPLTLSRDVLFDDAVPIGATARSSSRNPVEWETDPAIGAPSGRRVIRQAAARGYTDTFEFKLRPLTVGQEGTFEVWVRADPVNVPQSLTFSVPGKGSATWNRTEAGFVRSGQQEAAIPPGTWTKLSIPAGDLGLKPGDAVPSISVGLNNGVAWWNGAKLSGNPDSANDPLVSFVAWRKRIGTTPPTDLPGEYHATVKAGPDGEVSEEDLEKLRRYYVAIIARPLDGELAAARSAWESARAARIVAEETAPGTFIYREANGVRDSFVMLRGQYDKPGEQVEPAVPAFLPRIEAPEGQRLSRLDLAHWLVSPENPLTARVTVNRLWQQFFGTGLVKSSNDFGVQGEPPSHPELLDWLAVHFRESGWDVKAFVKLLVTSDAFRRDATVTPEVLKRDPQNRLYARGPRLRLDAEQVRDNVLFVSGLISLKMGGRGVNPYQPPNIWEPVGYSDSNTRFYLQDYGESLYRRSMYVFLKRTAPPPFMSNFDGPNREQVCIVRERTNTPLQALQLMNDVQHFEAARSLAERVLSEGGETTTERVTWLYRIVLSRIPDEEESRLVSEALETQLSLYRADPAAAAKAIQVGESKPKNIAPPEDTAAWTMIANLILNLDETVNRN